MVTQTGKTPYIWVSSADHASLETGECDDLGVVYDQLQGHHAQWVARLEVSDTETNWSDWQLFVASLHSPPDQARPPDSLYTFALRITGTGCYLLGKAFGETPLEGREQAEILWEMVRSLLPKWFILTPATTSDQFEEFSGFGLEERARQELDGIQFAELRRYQERVSVENSENLYLLYIFSPHRAGWRQLSQALATGQSLLLTLHPTWLYPVEREELAHLESLFGQLASSEDFLTRQLGEAGRDSCRSLLFRLKRGYVVRIYLLSQKLKLPGWLVQAAGAALSVEEPEKQTALQVGLPCSGVAATCFTQWEDELTEVEQEAAARNILLLENEFFGVPLCPARYERLQYLCGLPEAAALFRPPGINI